MNWAYAGAVVTICALALGCSKVADDGASSGGRAAPGGGTIANAGHFEIERDAALPAGLPAPQQTRITVTIEDDSVQVGEWLHIAVENTGREPVEYLSVDIDMVNEGSWSTVRNDVECPHDALAKKAFTHLAPGAKNTYTWDLRAQDGSFVDAGIFRVSINTRPVGRNEKQARTMACSNPFRMKETR